ncbi:uncharacterized protein LOC112541054 [Python bivittatus]|uniref:Uncharacterized protein LOC112541054 n=1 Tax=Python bivittatus TaxID=176946 RepID=A0A9F5IW21_PYTBI|nr:uncharacterized protein LOC112541054 [Python bivittatus]
MNTGKESKRGAWRSAEPPLWSLPPAEAEANLPGPRSSKGEREAPGRIRSLASLPFLPSSPSAPPFSGGKQSRPPAGRRLEVPRPSCRASYWSRLSTLHAGFKNGPGQPGREERKGSAGLPRPAARRRQLSLLAERHSTGLSEQRGHRRRYFGLTSVPLDEAVFLTGSPPSRGKALLFRARSALRRACLSCRRCCEESGWPRQPSAQPEGALGPEAGPAGPLSCFSEALAPPARAFLLLSPCGTASGSPSAGLSASARGKEHTCPWSSRTGPPSPSRSRA